jgi:molecular chaperone HscC
LEWNLTKIDFERIVEPLLQKIKHPIERALRDAKLKPSDLDEVVLVGGATRMPVIRSLVSKIIRRIPVSTINPDEVVCHGAVIQAALLEKHEALKDVVLTDVSPYTMGIEIASSKGNGNYEAGHFMPIIERNSVVPISRADRVNTVQNGQRELSVEIFQGENRLVKNNIFLGRLSVNVPKNKAGEECVDIRFTYDTNGILEVMTKVVSTGYEQSLLIENSGVNMSKDQIEESLKKLSSIKLHPREAAQNIALFARAERLYEEALGDSRNYIGHIIGQFEQALDTQDHEVAKQAREDLDKVLDEIEGAGVLS